MTEKKSVGELFTNMGPYLVLGGELAGVTLAGVLIGWWIDSSFATTPWGLVIGAALGATGGMIKFIREATTLASEDKDKTHSHDIQ